MPAHSFESLLRELGEKIEIPDLESTRENNVTLTLKGNNNVVLEKHKTQPYLVIIFQLAELPMSRYRENIFREALKFNNLNKPHEGIFAYSKKTQNFFLFDMIPLDDTSGEQVATIMEKLSEKVTVWKEALNRGDIPSIGFSSQSRSGGGIFGIRP